MRYGVFKIFRSDFLSLYCPRYKIVQNMIAMIQELSRYVGTKLAVLSYFF